MAHGAPDFWTTTTPGMPIIGAGQVVWFQSEAFEVVANSHRDLINYVVPDDMELHVCSGLVSCKFPRTQRYDLRATPAATWISPTSFIDAYDEWAYEEKAYDNDVATSSVAHLLAEEWGKYLILLVNETNIDKVRFYAKYDVIDVTKIDVDVYYEGDWHNVYEGAFASHTWVEKAIPDGVELVSKARIRFYNVNESWRVGRLHEFQFNTSGITPQEGIYFDTHAIIPFTSQAPYIVPSKATFAVRVYNDDDVKQWMAVSLAGFLQAKV